MCLKKISNRVIDSKFRLKKKIKKPKIFILFLSIIKIKNNFKNFSLISKFYIIKSFF